jgi:hypothetical protein
MIALERHRNAIKRHQKLTILNLSHYASTLNCGNELFASSTTIVPQEWGNMTPHHMVFNLYPCPRNIVLTKTSKTWCLIQAPDESDLWHCSNFWKELQKNIFGKNYRKMHQ